MNYLAHLHLTPRTPAGFIGALLPDLVKVRDLSTLDPGVAQAVLLHRKIDAYTDTHPVFLQSKARLFDAHGRYAGILVDLFYDHFLTATWDQHDDTPLDGFLDEVHRGFDQHHALMPAPMREFAHRLTEQNWLKHYETLEGLAQILTWMSRRFEKRFRRPVDLTAGVDTLRAEYSGLQDDFDDYYPQLMAYTQRALETLA